MVVARADICVPFRPYRAYIIRLPDLTLFACLVGQKHFDMQMLYVCVCDCHKKAV